MTKETPKKCSIKMRFKAFVGEPNWRIPHAYVYKIAKYDWSWGRPVNVLLMSRIKRVMYTRSLTQEEVEYDTQAG